VARFRRLFQQGLRNPMAAAQIIRNLPKFIRLYWRLFCDRRVPLYLKIFLSLTVVYVISPVDLLSDWVVPVAGYMDDFVLLIFVLRFFLQKCPEDVLMEHVTLIESEN
jgi:uncharacterized membrane protein YkvA (DUF1232 family)